MSPGRTISRHARPVSSPHWSLPSLPTPSTLIRVRPPIRNGGLFCHNGRAASEYGMRRPEHEQPAPDTPKHRAPGAGRSLGGSMSAHVRSALHHRFTVPAWLVAAVIAAVVALGVIAL